MGLDLVLYKRNKPINEMSLEEELDNELAYGRKTWQIYYILRDISLKNDQFYEISEDTWNKFIAQIKYAMEENTTSVENIEKALDIYYSWLNDPTEEERKNYYPISIYCPNCKKDSTKISNYDKETGEVSYSCSCGHHDTLNINSATNIKLQWKVMLNLAFIV